MTTRPEAPFGFLVKRQLPASRCEILNWTLSFDAKGLARSNLSGGISKDGVRKVLLRTFNPNNTYPQSNEGDAR